MLFLLLVRGDRAMSLLAGKFYPLFYRILNLTCRSTELFSGVEPQICRGLTRWRMCSIDVRTPKVGTNDGLRRP